MSRLTPGREAALRDHGPIPTDVWGEIDAIRGELARVSAQRDEYWKLDADIGALRAELAEAKFDLEAKQQQYLAAVESGQEYAKAWAEANARVAELVAAAKGVCERICDWDSDVPEEAEALERLELAIVSFDPGWDPLADDDARALAAVKAKAEAAKEPRR